MSLLEAARKSKSDTEGKLEELRGIVSKVRKHICFLLKVIMLCVLSGARRKYAH